MDMKPLTEREIEILILACHRQGYNCEEMGKILHIAKTTTETHLARIYAKTKCKNRTQLLYYAIERGYKSIDAASKTRDFYLVCVGIDFGFSKCEKGFTVGNAIEAAKGIWYRHEIVDTLSGKPKNDV